MCRRNIYSEVGDLCCQLRDHFGQKRNRCHVVLCRHCDIFQRYCVVLLHLCIQGRVGFCGLHIGCISFSLRIHGGYLRLFKGSREVRFEVPPHFSESLFAGTLPAILLIEPAFFDVCKRHRDNLGGRIRILNRERFLVTFNPLGKFFENGFARNWFLHPPINFLDIVIFQFRVLGGKVSQNL